MSTSAERALADTYRSDWGRLLSLLVTRSRRLDLAEDALGEAFVRASQNWEAAGIPANPSGWLYTSAWRLIIGGLRAEAMHGRKAALLAVDAAWQQSATSGDTADLDDFEDDRLALILLCCHPALHVHARSPLALRLVIGTTTAEIARLFLVSTPTMAARITRAKKKIVVAGIPLSRPAHDELNVRLDDVCRTIYLAFTAGYTPGVGPDLLRSDLAGEAVELASVLHRLVPQASQVRALLALLLLQHARRDARVDSGELVTLANQDRARWRADEIAEGADLIGAVPHGNGYTEELRLQGAIALQHAQAGRPDDTDWSRIAELYSELEALTESPVVRLNRAVAVAEAHGPAAGLDLLIDLDAALANNHRLHAVRADLARRIGDTQQARAEYDRALALCTNAPERAYLATRLTELDGVAVPDVRSRPGR